MKKLPVALFLVSIVLCLNCVSGFADVGPKPTLDIVVDNINVDTYYLDLLSQNDAGNDVEYSDFNSKYPESYKELPLYKYYEDGWMATHIRISWLWGNLRTEANAETTVTNRFTYFGIPKKFKVIIQYETGELFVSNKEYSFDEYNQVTDIDFNNDMTSVTSLKGDSCKLTLHSIGGAIEVKVGDASEIIGGDSELVYPKGTNITLTPIPPPGFITFDRWSGSIEGSERQLNLNLDSDMEFWAHFKLMYIRGDVNGDDTVNSIDLAYMRMHLLGMISDFPGPCGQVAADINRDYKVNSIDIAYLRQYLLGMINEL